MRIVHVAPYCETVPPPRDGGTERAIHELTEGLAAKGHEVILFAPPGSSSSGKLISYPEQPISEEDIGKFVLGTLPEGADLIHDHTFSSAIGKMNLPIPTVCTMHLTNNNGVRHPVYVSRRALEQTGKNIGHFIYNGLRFEQYQFSDLKDNYLLFMGRIIREKGILLALDIAERTNRRLIIAGPKHDPELFRTMIEPRLLANPNLIYVGSVGGQQKQDLLKHADCVLFPSLWEEPFGLVMIEAMACGTRVLALNTGSVPEVMAGFPQLICRSPEEMVNKLLFDVPQISPYALRQYVVSRFSAEVMTERYVDYYLKVIRETPRAAAAPAEAVGTPAAGQPEPVPMPPTDAPPAPLMPNPAPPVVSHAGRRRGRSHKSLRFSRKQAAGKQASRRQPGKPAANKAKAPRTKRKKSAVVRPAGRGSRKIKKTA
ncbi:glycosyltransferase family 4 protein [Paenibacillus hamazuiensis]|uniref:glycosyltransferase family 4 protein n=1 Tax=Paenibacillus hamazuiensis TaxID=2936508 RepID=UPI00200D20DA|nr:glycosyltransferase family 4 protein [Paenibacillus hamazuiensis]